MIRIGWIGWIGWIGCATHAGEMLLPQLVRLDARLDALCDIDAYQLARIANRYGIGARYIDPARDALIWEPNLTAAANEDHKDYHALVRRSSRACAASHRTRRISPTARGQWGGWR
jgi:predicted dehydrogenase